MINLKNIKPLGVKEEFIMDLLQLYQFKGKDYYYDNLFKNDSEAIIRKNIKSELLAVAEYLKLDITEPRKKLLFKKNCQPKNNDEKFYINLKNTLVKFIGNYKTFEFESNEILMLVKRLYGDSENIRYRTYKQVVDSMSLVENTKLVSLRDEIQAMLVEFKMKLDSKKYENTNLIANFYIDYINQEFFTNHNDFLAIMIMYVLLFASGFTVFKYTSFFELLIKYKSELKNATLKANMNYEDGYSDTRMLDELIIKILLEAYDNVEEYVNAYSFDTNNSKEDNIVTIIYKLPQEFTKDDIRNRDPLSSDSTINRALQRLSKEKKIRSLGYGRSAKWLRIEKEQSYNDLRQISLFELTDEDHDLD
jgi:hypothetical protein